MFKIVKVDGDNNTLTVANDIKTREKAAKAAFQFAEELCNRTPNDPFVDTYGNGYAVFIGVYRIANYEIVEENPAPTRDITPTLEDICI